MKLVMALIVVALGAWLVLWATGTGVLLYSSNTGVLSTRDCRYLVGVTVQKRLEPLAQRCPLIRAVGR